MLFQDGAEPECERQGPVSSWGVGGGCSWLPGWPQQRFKACDKRMFRDFDTVSVDIKDRGVFELHVNPEAVTNLRANIEDRNLWDKALLARAMGPRPWLPFQAPLGSLFFFSVSLTRCAR